MNIDDSGGTARDLSTDINSLDFATPRGVQITTGVSSSAQERLQLIADFTANFAGTFDDGANLAHDVFKTVSSTSVTRTITIVHSGQTLPNEANLDDYQLTRSATGELTFSVPATLNSTVVPTWA